MIIFSVFFFKKITFALECLFGMSVECLCGMSIRLGLSEALEVAQTVPINENRRLEHLVTLAKN